MAKSFGIKYLLSILDAFSRKGMIYGTNSKKSDNLLKHIIEFCMNNKIPKEFLSDNGAEFKNKYINDFCNMYNIKFIHGSPYSPHSQSIIERFNYTIKKYLAKEFLANNNNKFDFNEVRFKIINYYNNKKHRILGMSPNEAYKLTDPDKITVLDVF